MIKETAKTFIRDTFQNPFDKEGFIRFTDNLLNKVDKSKAFHARGYVPEIFKDIVKTYERLGTYTDPNGSKTDVLIVYLQKDTSLDRARTAQRNFAARYLKDRGGKDAGLIAFVPPDSEDWRFSLVKMEYRLEETGGKIKAKEELTPARRWSFLVGKNENSHTAQKQLLPLLENDELNPHLSDFEEAFNIEKVTKEFFAKYRDLFLWVEESLTGIVKKDAVIAKDFSAKSVDSVNFSKKLLGQIVFLYFLQKKGWFGVKRGKDWGDGSKHFLRELFDKKHGGYKNFFNDILEPLFYEALRLERPTDYYSRFECRIPFLNGGLFDPINDYNWQDTDILLPNGLFSNDEKTKEGDTGTGILDVFDRYNFTVKEDEPLEKEVAIDPEMLGKVFENLLEVKDRKSKGTYYTPREIVHYMCQESLINYLSAELVGADYNPPLSKEDIETLIKYGETAVEHDSRVINEGRETETYSFKLPESIRSNAQLVDDKLSAIRVCDPAVGSGAFLVGMMNEIVRARNALSSYLSFRVGAGSEPAPTEQRKPLGGSRTAPTIYEYKRHAIQSCLYGVDIDAGATEIAKLRLWLSLVVDEDDIKQIKPLPNLDYKIVCGNSLLGVEQDLTNVHLFTELEKLKPLHFNETSAGKKQKYKEQIDALIKELTHNETKFDFEIYFSEVFHTTSPSPLTGTSPFEKGGLRGISGEGQGEGVGKRGFDVVIANPPYGGHIDSQRATFSRLYPNTTRQFRDIYKVFIELGLTRVCAPSGILCYITPNTLIRQARYKDVRKFLMAFTIIELVNLGEEVFEEVVVPTCFFFVKKDTTNCNVVVLKDISHKSKFTGELLSVRSEGVPQTHFLKTTDNAFATEHHHLGENQVFLEDVLDFKDAGINYQRVNVGMSEKGKSDLGQRLLYEGVTENSNDVEFWKGEDLGKYFIARSTGRYVRMKTQSHLKSNERVILNREFFETVPKLIWRQTAPHLIVSVDERGIWFGRSIQGALIKSTKRHLDYRYICGVLNSSYLQFKYNSFVREEGRVFPQVKWSKIRKLPIPDVQPDDQRSIIKLVDKILAITKSGDYLTNASKQAKVVEYEREIDELVYKLYELTPEEIKIVENSNT